MRRRSLLVLLCVLAIPAIAFADHGPPTTGLPGAAVDAPLTETGDVRLIETVQTIGRAGVAAPFGEGGLSFTRDGKSYVLVSNVTYGFAVMDVTDRLHPVVVSEYAASGACPEAVAETLVAGSFGAFTATQGFENDISLTPDGRIVILGMDDSGRCHDPHEGGIELIDLTDVTNPRTIHLTRNVGMAHSITIDPKRPWLAYLSTSDRSDLMDIVDFKSCLGGVAALASCKPEIARAVFDKRFWPQIAVPGQSADPFNYGCHDLRFRGDRAYCAAVSTTAILDVSKVVGPDGRLTGTKLTDNNMCPTLPAARAPGVKITDCMVWTNAQFQALKGVPVDMALVSLIKHDGSKPADQDIQISHQAEVIADGTIMMVTDERGGGLSNEAGCPGGGLWFYDIRDETKPVLMKTPEGGRGVYRTAVNPPAPISMSPSCTIHYGQEFADENLLFFAWYNAGFRGIRYTADFTTTPATIGFEEIAATTLPGTMAIQAAGITRNPADSGEVIVYVTDAVRGVDVLGVKVPRVTRTQAITKAGAKPAVKPAAKPAARPAAVKGIRRELPATGVGSSMLLGLVMLAPALALAATLRRRTAP